MNILTSKQDNQHDSAKDPKTQERPQPPDAVEPAETHPHPLDGSQYHNVIEEQEYAERRPTPEEQRPWRISHPDQEQPSSHVRPDPSISIGTK